MMAMAKMNMSVVVVVSACALSFMSVFHIPLMCEARPLYTSADAYISDVLKPHHESLVGGLGQLNKGTFKGDFKGALSPLGGIPNNQMDGKPLSAGDAQSLQLNNVTQVDYKHGWNYYKVSVPQEAANKHMVVQVQGLVEEPHGNLDLFIKVGSVPDFDDFDYADTGCQQDYKTFAGILVTGGNYHEACTGTQGEYYLGLYSQVLIKGRAQIWPRII